MINGSVGKASGGDKATGEGKVGGEGKVRPAAERTYDQHGPSSHLTFMLLVALEKKHQVHKERVQSSSFSRVRYLRTLPSHTLHATLNTLQVSFEFDDLHLTSPPSAPT